MRITLEWLSTQPFELASNGREIRYNCPNCDDHTGHLYVNATREKWYCFKCGRGGRVEVVTQKAEPNLESFKLTKGNIFSVGTVELGEKLHTVKSLPLHRALPHIEIAEDCESGEELTARNYLYSRGVTQDEIIKYNISLSLEKSGPYKNSIIFPVRSPYMSTLEYFVCRKYDNSKPKYVNAPWPKDDALFIAKGKQAIPIIVEGVFDAIAIARVGFDGIALLGKAATSKQLDRLTKIYTQYIIYLDNDALTHAIQLKLQLSSLGIPSMLIRQDKDAADLYLEGNDMLKKAITNAR